MDTSQLNFSPSVSVVMPVCNDARTMRGSGDSVLTQTFKDLELVVWNDASTDESASILENVKDDRVRVL